MESDFAEVPLQPAQRCGLFLARFCIAAWIGAATLFVVVGVREVTRGGFDVATRDTLVAIRFPAFYLFGFALVGAGWLGTILAGHSAQFPRGRRLVSLILLSCVLVLMAVDYFTIYQPLLQMVTPPGQAKPSTFVTYHQASKWINFGELALCLVVTMLINIPAGAPFIRRVE